ncbi:hypothetical protein [Verrucomicrobium sp. BvORR106]|uniref:tetratricopeptide repeat protein n=1 Tax=Verrucomicrobium sp. BvORR106 TaxID=1403819 RepID=UPI00057140A2|nr:hypothetical protein [Verrucomicrobium sp. BvORR106]
MATRRSLSVALLAAGTCLTTPSEVNSCGPMYYAAAPMLSAFPERHPVKTMLDLFADSQKASVVPEKEPVGWLVGRLLSAKREDRIQIIDSAIAANRMTGVYESRMANLLWDLRDLRSAWEGDFNAEAKAYVDWRVYQYEKEKRGLPPSIAAEHRKVEDGWWMSPKEKADEVARLAQEQAAIKAGIEEGERAIAQASPALAPHWMVARGGAAFRRGALEEAAGWFDKVVQNHAGHPRRETALYMVARIKIEEARRISRKQLEAEKDRPEESQDLFQALESAEHALDEYSKEYAAGRYLAEVAGWRGAIHSLAGRHWEALGAYVTQLDHADQPEVRSSAGREIERCLKELLATDRTKDNSNNMQDVLNLLAVRPEATLRVMGFFLDGPADFGYEARYWDEDYLNQEKLDRIKTMLGRSRHAAMLQRLAATALDHEGAFKAASWHPRFVALMAWAATEGGQHAQALRICERQPEALVSSDDLQYCRAVTLQRLGDDARAAEAFQAMRERFPKSRLTDGLALRQAQSLHRLGKDGEAIVILNSAIAAVEIVQREPRPVGAASPSPLNSHQELSQYLGVLEQFCPLPQLEVALRSLQLPAATSPRLHQLVVARLLAVEDWRSLRRVLGTPPAGPDPDEEAERNHLEDALSYWEWGQPSLMHFYARKDLHAGLARALMLLHEPSKTALTPAQKALWHWSIASVWQAVRGQLTLSAVYSSPGDYMASDHRQMELRLRTNALALGYRLETVDRALEARDELRHTFQHCLKAADLAPGSALAARALHKALECLRRMAEVSPYAQARAFEGDWGGLSRQLYDRLLKECPDSPEAGQLAAWWNFAAPPELHGWMPGNGYPAGEDYEIREILVPDATTKPRREWNQQLWQRESERRRQFDVLRGRLQKLGSVFDSQGLEAARTESKAIRQALIPLADALDWTTSINALDAADLVLNQPAPEAEAVKRHFLHSSVARASEQTPAPASGSPAVAHDTDGLDDLSAYRAAAAAMEEDRGMPDQWSLQETRWQSYLHAYPQSLKREAAQFQLARAITRQHRGWTHVSNRTWPEAPFVGTYVRLVVQREKPFDARRANAALDAYTKAYPEGRYLADVSLFRAGVAVDAGDYPEALRLLCAALGDENHKELHLDAALALAQCFEKLHDPEKRRPLAQAIAADPLAWDRFTVFTRSASCGQRLRVYEDWVASLKK